MKYFYTILLIALCGLSINIKAQETPKEQPTKISINQAPLYLNKLVTICDSVYSIKIMENQYVKSRVVNDKTSMPLTYQIFLNIKY